jgi:elongation factor G
MKVEVVTPEEFLGDVMADLNSRRAQVQRTDSRGNAQVVVATAPMAALFGLEKQLKARTGGKATVSMVFERYELVLGTDTDPDDRYPAAAALRA